MNAAGKNRQHIAMDILADEEYGHDALPPESRRVYDANIDNNLFQEKGAGEVVKRKKWVNFFMKPDGLDADWVVKTEWVVV